MRSVLRFQLCVGALLLAAFVATTASGLSRVLTGGARDTEAEDAAAQDIASAAASAVDRGTVEQLPSVMGSLLARYPRVLAVEVVPEGAPPVVEIGQAERLRASTGSGASGVRRVTLVRDGRPWGVVRLLFERPRRPAVINPESSVFWAVAGLSVLVLPVLIWLLERARRRLDRSAAGPMAVAAERARHTLDTLAEAVLLLDAKGGIVFANTAFGEVLERRPASMVGVSITELPWATLPEGGPQDVLPWCSVLAGGEPVRGIRLGLRCAASTAVFMVNCTPLIQGRHALQGVLVTLDDVTELEHSRVALQSARDAAQHANEAKSRFLAMMSHEIRTPLNGVCGSLQLLKQTNLADRQPRYVDAAGFSASTLLHLINDILDFSKIEAGQFELSPVEFDLERCIDDTMLMLSQGASAKGLTLAYEIEPGVGARFIADPDRIRQVVINLVNNAIKFTQQGSVTLRVSAEGGAPERQMLRCAISDTGIGIPPAKMGRLFKAFSQVDSSTSRRYGGTGLGLVISKQLCELMGGRIEVASVEGRGTTFTAFMDLKRDPGRDPERPSQPAPPAQWALYIGLHEFETRTACREIAVPEGRVVVCSDLEDLSRRMRTEPGLLAAGPVVAVVAHPDATDLARSVVRIHELLPRENVFVVRASYAPEGPAGGDSEAGCWLNRPIGRQRLSQALRQASARDGEGEQAASSNAGGAPDLTGLRLLLAEDNPVGQMVISDMLRNAGARCDAVADGAQVLAALKSRPYDLVLMDCFMPELDGFETTRRIRELQRRGELPANLPVVALTAKAMRGDKEACLEAGMDGYVTKPVDQSELLRVVGKHAGRDGPPQAPTLPAPGKGATDLAMLEERFSSKTDLLGKLIAAYRDTAAQDLSRIEKALEAGHAKTIEEAAHRLAGGAGFVCAGVVRRLASELERLAIEGQSGAWAGLAQQLREETIESIKDLERFLASRVSSPSPAPGGAKEIIP